MRTAVCFLSVSAIVVLLKRTSSLCIACALWGGRARMFDILSLRSVLLRAHRWRTGVRQRALRLSAARPHALTSAESCICAAARRAAALSAHTRRSA